MRLPDGEDEAIIDISVPLLPGMAIYAGDPHLSLERVASLDEGATANVSRLDMGVHTGTHIDAPIHFLPDGAAAEHLALETLIGPAQVVDATAGTGHLDAATLASLEITVGVERVLFKTRNSALWESGRFETGFIGLTADGAEWLVARGVQLVAVDYLSVAPYGDPTPTHRALLGAGVVILEGIDLRGVEPGPYRLICLPLRLVGSDGAPARAILLPDHR
jgi:arylformamidase